MYSHWCTVLSISASKYCWTTRVLSVTCTWLKTPQSLCLGHTQHYNNTKPGKISGCKPYHSLALVYSASETRSSFTVSAISRLNVRMFNNTLIAYISFWQRTVIIQAKRMRRVNVSVLFCFTKPDLLSAHSEWTESRLLNSSKTTHNQGFTQITTWWFIAKAHFYVEMGQENVHTHLKKCFCAWSSLRSVPSGGSAPPCLLVPLLTWCYCWRVKEPLSQRGPAVVSSSAPR